MKKILFLCSRNKLRSPTAEIIFSEYEALDVRSAGLNNDAVNRISTEDVTWADIIFVMEKHHRDKLTGKYNKHLNNKKVYILNIPDEYEYMDTRLIEILKRKVPGYIGL